MKERDGSDTYWQEEFVVTDGLRLKVHTVRERYRSHYELIKLGRLSGERIYVHGRAHSGRDHEVGQAQAWFYPEDRLTVLWECYLFHGVRVPDRPLVDEPFKRLWVSFEGLLTSRFPAAERIVTPAWEPVYDTRSWQEFLRYAGFEPFTHATFTKPVPSTRAGSEVVEGPVSPRRQTR